MVSFILRTQYCYRALRRTGVSFTRKPSVKQTPAFISNIEHILLLCNCVTGGVWMLPHWRVSQPVLNVSSSSSSSFHARTVGVTAKVHSYKTVRYKRSCIFVSTSSRMNSVLMQTRMYGQHIIRLADKQFLLKTARV